MRTDFHSHLYASTYLDLMVGLGHDEFRRTPRQDGDTDERIAAQDAAGVGRQVLSFIGQNTAVADPVGATDAAQCLNDIYAGVCAGSNGRLLSFGMLPLPHVDRAIEEAKRVLDEPTCVGIGVPCSVSGLPLDDPSLAPLWQELDARRALVFVHPVGSDSNGHWGMDAFGMSAMLGSPVQLAIAACRLVFSGLTTRHPGIRFLFAQGGGFLASRWEAIENIVLRPGLAGHAAYVLGWVQDLDLDPDDPMSRFRDLWFDTAGIHQMPTLLTTARATYGIDRLVLGSDARFGSLTDTVAFLSSTDLLDDAERHTLLDGGDARLGIGA